MKTILLLFLINTSITNSQLIERKYNSDKVSFRDISDSTKNYVNRADHSIDILVNNWKGSVIISNNNQVLKYTVNGQYDAFEKDSIGVLIFKECTIQNELKQSKVDISLVMNKKFNKINLLVELPNGDSYYYFNLTKEQ